MSEAFLKSAPAPEPSPLHLKSASVLDQDLGEAGRDLSVYDSAAKPGSPSALINKTEQRQAETGNVIWFAEQLRFMS